MTDLHITAGIATTRNATAAGPASVNGKVNNACLVDRAFDPARPRSALVYGHHRTPNRHRQGLPPRSSSTPGHRHLVGWSIADHVRAELVADAVQMAIWRNAVHARDQTVAHSDHGAPVHVLTVRQPASETPACSDQWATTRNCFDDSVAEAIHTGTMQRAAPRPVMTGTHETNSPAQYLVLDRMRRQKPLPFLARLRTHQGLLRHRQEPSHAG